MVEEMNQQSKSNKFRFTKADLLKVKCPPTQKCVYVYDDHTPTLGARITPSGTITFIFYKKVKGKPVRKNLEQDGQIMRLGPFSVEAARIAARKEHTQADHNPIKFLEGTAGIEAHEITLSKAFELALSGSTRGGRGEMALRDWNQARDKFLSWMKKKYSHVRTWVDLRRPHVKEYMADQKPTEKSQERGKTQLSSTRMRLIMQPICQTAKYMWHEYEIPNVAENLGLSAKLNKAPAPVYLEDVLAFLDYLKKGGHTSLEAGAALAGLCGLQLLEVLRLTWNKVDLKRALVEISGEVKNEYRNRVIPIPARALEALKRAHEHRPIEEVQSVDGGHVVTSPDGFPFKDKSWMNYSKLLKGQMRAWNGGINWAPKDLRNCVLTLGALRGFSGDVLEQYVGHAPRTVTARNYIPRLASTSIGEAGELKRQMDVFKKLVVEQVEAEIAEAKKDQGDKVVDVVAGVAESSAS